MDISNQINSILDGTEQKEGYKLQGLIYQQKRAVKKENAKRRAEEERKKEWAKYGAKTVEEYIKAKSNSLESPNIPEPPEITNASKNSDENKANSKALECSNGKKTLEISNEFYEVFAKALGIGLITAREGALIQFLHTHKQATSKDICEFFSWTQENTRFYIFSLKRKNIIKKENGIIELNNFQDWNLPLETTNAQKSLEDSNESKNIDIDKSNTEPLEPSNAPLVNSNAPINDDVERRNKEALECSNAEKDNSSINIKNINNKKEKKREESVERGERKREKSLEPSNAPLVNSNAKNKDSPTHQLIEFFCEQIELNSKLLGCYPKEAKASKTILQKLDNNFEKAKEVIKNALNHSYWGEKIQENKSLMMILSHLQIFLEPEQKKGRLVNGGHMHAMHFTNNEIIVEGLDE